MDDQATRLLTEIRDLLERTVANQERVLRANDESLQLYRTAARRQVMGIALALSVIALFFLFFSTR